MRCPGCCNPEMLAFAGGTEIAPEDLAARALATPEIEGVSLLGGEPFAQAAGCAAFARAARAGGLSVMVFSGFTRAEIEARDDDGARALLAACDLLVDGRYDRTQPDTGRRWIGSSNQVLHHLSERYAADDPCFRAPDTVEVRLRAGELVINGTPAGARAILPGVKAWRSLRR